MGIFITPTTSVIQAVHAVSSVDCVSSERCEFLCFFLKLFLSNSEPVICYFLTFLFVLLQGTIGMGVFLESFCK